MTISEEELRQRLTAIMHGPWSQGVAEARRKLGPLEELDIPVTGTGRIALDQIHLSVSNKQRSEQLSTVLRPHFKDRKGITSPTEIEMREALDQALTLPELLGIAVQTGYVSIDRIKKPARKILTDLLWSAAARSFVANYGYAAVSMLAARVGVSGLNTAPPPEPDPNAALRFAGFLAHLRAFYSCTVIQGWTDFLDDYIQEPNEQVKLRQYLKMQRTIAPKRTMEILAGCQFFVTSLASALDVLDDDELGHFGLIHGYWLQKFFGYKIGNNGYEKDLARWGSADSWAHTFFDQSPPRTGGR